MMELRWILLALGVMFLLGLYWWETRRQRQAADHSSALRPPDPFSEIAEPVSRRREPEPLPWEEEAEERAGSLDEPITRLRPEFSAGPDVDDPRTVPLSVERVEPRLGDAAAAVRVAAPVFVPPSLDRSDAEELAAEAAEAADEASDLLEVEIDEVPELESAQSVAPLTPAESADTPRGPEKLVTIRLSAPPLERFEGRALVNALAAAGLEHGRFSIFHRLGADGSELFSVASLVEPGTFDLDAIDGRRFPGVSLFALLHKPAEAPQVLEDMLSTARKLATQLQGTLQDERGAPLSSFRMTELRSDVIAWQRSCAQAR